MINEEIRDREVRVVDENGEQMGILPIRQALELAEQKQLDLVKIAPQAKPPVCKLMDYGKYRFEQSKKEREMRKNQKVVNIKEVRLSATIEEHDIDVKTRAAQKFLKDGDKVKVSIRFRGRQITHSEIGTEIMHDFAERIKDFGVMERKPIIEGRNMIKRYQAYKRHILTKKPTKRTRNLRKAAYVASTEARTMKKLIPYK